MLKRFVKTAMMQLFMDSERGTKLMHLFHDAVTIWLFGFMVKSLFKSKI